MGQNIKCGIELLQCIFVSKVFEKLKLYPQQQQNKLQYIQPPILTGQLTMTLTDVIKDFFCGCVSGWTQVVVMQPFEIVKVRLINQSSASPEYSGIVDCFTKIKKQEGFKAFYKGSLAPLLGIGAQVALQFGSNGLIKRFLLNFQDEYEQQDAIPTLGIVFISGLLTGIPSSIVTTPVDHTRILMQIQKGNDMNNKYHSSIDAGISIYKKHGIKGLYLGFYPTLLRENIALSVYFSAYELGMRMMTPDGEDLSQAPILGAFVAGGISGCCSWLFTYPIDYVKTVIQSQSLSKLLYKSATECAIKKYKKHGFKTFFKGFGVTMMRSFPVNGAGFFSFEVMMRLTGRKVTVHNLQHLEVF